MPGGQNRILSMSTNLNVYGIRAVTVNATGEQSSQVIRFDLWQTPSKITEQILASSDIIQAYKDWVSADKVEEVVDVYADDDYFQEHPPIGVKTVCDADEHLADFDEFIEQCADGYYQLTFYGQ